MIKAIQSKFPDMSSQEAKTFLHFIKAIDRGRREGWIGKWCRHHGHGHRLNKKGQCIICLENVKDKIKERNINICVECGKKFDPKLIDHTSAFWRRSDGKHYSYREYCSVECVGRADGNWRTSYADHIVPYDDEENLDESAIDTYEN